MVGRGSPAATGGSAHRRDQQPGSCAAEGEHAKKLRSTRQHHHRQPITGHGPIERPFWLDKAVAPHNRKGEGQAANHADHSAQPRCTRVPLCCPLVRTANQGIGSATNARQTMLPSRPSARAPSTARTAGHESNHTHTDPSQIKKEQTRLCEHAASSSLQR
jgi:hypothetical protein